MRRRSIWVNGMYDSMKVQRKVRPRFDKYYFYCVIESCLNKQIILNTQELNALLLFLLLCVLSFAHFALKTINFFPHYYFYYKDTSLMGV